MAHFGLSMIILIAPSRSPGAPPIPPARDRGPTDRLLVWTVRAIAVLGAITIFAGTAADRRRSALGRHVGQHVKRLHFRGAGHARVGGPPARDDRRAVRPRVIAVWLLNAPRCRSLEPTEPLTVLGVLVAAQGLVGTVQYELKLPAEMVWVHVALATVTWLVAAVGGGGGRRLGSPRRAASPGEPERRSASRSAIAHALPIEARRWRQQRCQLDSTGDGQGVATPSLNILVVDDESDLREMLTRSFSREGHRVMAVADGRAAIDRASTEHFDIVLLDVALGPGPDGYEVCRTLRGRRNVVPIIMLTALDSEADAVLGLEAGADDYVTKPFGLAELRSRIRAVLRRAGTRGDGRRGAHRRADLARPRPARGDDRRHAGEAHLLRVRAARRADDRSRAACSTARSCCGRSGATAPTATRARSTSTSGTCARSSSPSPTSRATS